MGTRADFYVGRGAEAEWLGSIAWDGYPGGVDLTVRTATTQAAFRKAVSTFFAGRKDVTLPAQGWPWPWENSQTTDFAYAFDGGRVYASCFGHRWFDAREEDEPHRRNDDSKPTVFPDMTSRQRVTLGKRSGVIIVGAGGVVESDD